MPEVGQVRKRQALQRYYGRAENQRGKRIDDGPHIEEALRRRREEILSKDPAIMLEYLCSLKVTTATNEEVEEVPRFTPRQAKLIFATMHKKVPSKTRYSKRTGKPSGPLGHVIPARRGDTQRKRVAKHRGH